MGLPFFFFGTLMDADVLARVLQRPIAGAAELAPALLWGYRRLAVANAVYPVLRPDRASHVGGVLFQPRDADERARIDHFEADEYVARPHAVQAGARLAAALVYLDEAGVFAPLGEPWSLATWQERHKASYLARCEVWMADYVPPERPLSAPADPPPAPRAVRPGAAKRG